MKKIGNSMVLMLTALIWGFAFVAQSEGMKHIAPFTFNGIRSLLGGIALIPVVLILRAKKKEPLTGEGARTLILGGLSCGFVLFVASTLQQYALINASPGKGGFLTALYIVIVPLLGIFLKKKPGLPIIFAVIAALVGLISYALTMKSLCLPLMTFFLCSPHLSLRYTYSLSTTFPQRPMVWQCHAFSFWSAEFSLFCR